MAATSTPSLLRALFVYTPLYLVYGIYGFISTLVPLLPDNLLSRRLAADACDDGALHLPAGPRRSTGFVDDPVHLARMRLIAGAARVSAMSAGPAPPISFPAFCRSEFETFTKALCKDMRLGLVYLHCEENDYTPRFCRETLADKDLHRVLADSDIEFFFAPTYDERGMEIASTLQAPGFPYVAMFSPVSDEGRSELSILFAKTGFVTADELISIIQIAIVQAQPLLLGAKKTKAEVQEHRSLRDEQEDAYQRSLRIDREKQQKEKEDRARKDLLKQKLNKQKAALRAKYEMIILQRANNRAIFATTDDVKAPASQAVTLKFRFPDGRSCTRKFDSKASKVLSLYQFADTFDPLGTEEMTAEEYAVSRLAISPNSSLTQIAGFNNFDQNHFSKSGIPNLLDPENDSTRGFEEEKQDLLPKNFAKDWGFVLSMTFSMQNLFDADLTLFEAGIKDKTVIQVQFF